MGDAVLWKEVAKASHPDAMRFITDHEKALRDNLCEPKVSLADFTFLMVLSQDGSKVFEHSWKGDNVHFQCSSSPWIKENFARQDALPGLKAKVYVFCELPGIRSMTTLELPGYDNDYWEDTHHFYSLDTNFSFLFRCDPTTHYVYTAMDYF